MSTPSKAARDAYAEICGLLIEGFARRDPPGPDDLAAIIDKHLAEERRELERLKTTQADPALLAQVRSAAEASFREVHDRIVEIARAALASTKGED